MAYLVNPPSYLSVETFQSMANDFDLSSYSSAQLQQKLCAASDWANSIMQRDLLAQEQTIRFIGDGTDRLDLGKALVLYIKRAQIVIPNAQGYSIPINELLLDYQTGDAFEYAPLYWAGAGYRSMFPNGAPIDVTLAWGYGYTAAKAPQWSAADQAGGGIPAGNYNVAITARTFWGETTASVVQYETATGSFLVTVTSGIGVYLYRIYVSSAADNTTLNASCVAGATSVTPAATAGMTVNSQWLIGSGATAEVVTVTGAVSGGNVPISATQFAHNANEAMIPAPLLVTEMPLVAYGASPITTEINSLLPQNNLFADPLPTIDTSAPPIPWAIQEATRLLTLVGIFEQNNLANRGLYMQRSAERTRSWKSTEGNSGRGVPTLAQQATDMLQRFVYRGMM